VTARRVTVSFGYTCGMAGSRAGIAAGQAIRAGVVTHGGGAPGLVGGVVARGGGCRLCLRQLPRCRLAGSAACGVVEDYGRGLMKAILALAVVVAALLTGFTIPIAIVAHTSSAGALVGARATCKPHGHRRCQSPSPATATTSSSPSPTDTSSPAPAATSSSPSPFPASTSPSPTPTAWAWCSGDPGGFMQFGNLALYNGEWNSGLPQEICGNSGSDWQVTTSQPDGQTSIAIYPDVQLNYNSSEPLVSGLNPAATSTFTETMNANPGTSAEAGYDIWLSGGGGPGRDEVMIWTDTFNRGTVGGATQIGTGSFCGQDWQLWRNGGELIWYLPANEQTGTVCPVAMLQDLQARGLLSPRVTLSQFEFGWEIASTGGVDETFQVSSYSVTGLPPSN
jgi:glycosyl hydrolase family 12